MADITIGKIVTFLNVINGIILIGFSVLSVVFLILGNILNLKFFLIFSPLFMILFGISLIAIQLKIRTITKLFPFLKSMLGRALFNIYLSSVIFYFFSYQDQTVLAWISALVLLLSGIVYLIVYFGCYSSSKQKESTLEQDSFKQTLM